MSTATTFSGVIRGILEHPTRGVVGVVEDLLAACPEQGLHLEWSADACRAQSLGAGANEKTNVSLRKSVFRAILARVAALCNERHPHSVSPYGGETELSLCQNQGMVFRVSFVNTPEEQRLTIAPVQPKANGAV
jgi:hypothetical protein